MTWKENEPNLPEELRREIFRALVDAQDQAMSVPLSRRTIAERYGINEDQIGLIEREGLDGDWPPL